MRALGLVCFAFAFSCGGQVGPQGDAGLPAPGTSACDEPLPASGGWTDAVPCIKCSDGNWHCYSSVYPPCPAGFTSCGDAADAGVTQCATCTNGAGESYECFGRSGVVDPVSCSQ
jgi:hypothetical protein